ncbi:MAG: rhodanese-like domain-containing protein [Actinobacteria bacterium]|nr:rhodanese-like domain-containing protein [Actinomycetota bacterium]
MPRYSNAVYKSVFFAMAVALLAIIALSGCSSEATTTTAAAPGDTATGYTDITPDQLAEMLENKDFVFVNTHVPYEGEIEQTDLFIDFERAAELVTELPADKDAKIVVYCRSDRMSNIAAAEWVKAGYTNIYNLEGGFVAWEDTGYELLDLGR